MFAAGPADAPLASENDNPASPNTGTALLGRFRFEVRFCIVGLQARVRGGSEVITRKGVS